MNINVLHYTKSILMSSRHQDEFKKDNATNIRTDYKNSGIGSNLCGPGLIEKYQLNEKEIHFEFYMK